MLTRLDLRYFKCFEQLRLPLAPLTLLAGPNASGKSSVLQALVLLHQTMQENEWSPRLSLNGNIVRLGAMSDVVSDLYGRTGFEVGVEAGDSSLLWKFDAGRRDMSMEVRSISVDGREYANPSALRYMLPPAELVNAEPLIERLHGLTYITAERMAPRETYDLMDPYTIQSVGPRGEHAASVLHWTRDNLMRPEFRVASAPPTLLRQAEARMQAFFPGCSVDLQQVQRTNVVTLGLRTSDAEEFRQPVHTGFGLTQALPIVVAVLSAKPGDVILIENPEVHLHPAGQALMGQLLTEAANAGLQILVETHSDHVLNGIRRGVKSGQLRHEALAIHYFQRRSESDAQVISPVIDDMGRIDHWPTGFFDQFDRDQQYFAGWTNN